MTLYTCSTTKSIQHYIGGGTGGGVGGVWGGIAT